MKIYDFESEDRLQGIKDHYEQVQQIRNSLSENRANYRNLAIDVAIDADSIYECCRSFEESLLINCYTYSEQLFKNFYYQIINKGGHKNVFLNTFIDTKIPPNKFSPNVLYEEIEKNLKKELYNDFKFTISKNRIEVEKYNQLVMSRHRYAHSGIFFYDFENYDDVIDLLEYLRYEVISLVINKQDVFTKQELHKNLKTLYELSSSLSKIPNSVKKNSEIMNLRNTARVVSKKFYTELQRVPLLNMVINDIKNMGESDLRKYRDSHFRSCKLFETLDAYISQKILKR